jgi:RHS repeat-associated protein
MVLRPAGLVLAAGMIGLLPTNDPSRHSHYPPQGVAVTPDGSTTATRPPNTNNYTATFNVKNTSTSQGTFTLTRESSSNITATGQSRTSVTLAANGGNINVDIYYNAGSPGSGYVKLWAEGQPGIDAGTWNVPVGPTAAVTPDAGTAVNRLTNTGPYSEMFTVKNNGTTLTTFTVTCSGSSNVTCTGVSPSSVQLAGGAQITDATATYSVGATGSGTLTLTATGGVGSDNGSYSVPVISYGVAVTPDSGEALLHHPNVYGGVTFTVKNTGTQIDTFDFSCAATGNITCDKDGFGIPSITPPFASIAGGAQTTVGVGIKTAAELGTGRVYLAAASRRHNSTDQGWFWVPVKNGTYGVKPSNGWTKGAFTNMSYTANFVLSNPDSVGHQYVLDCFGGGTAITCPTAPLMTYVMQPGETQNLSVGYQVGPGASGTDYIQLVVNGNELGPGKLNFVIWPNIAHGVSVTPPNGTGPNVGSFTNGYTTKFTVRNVGTTGETYNFTCQSSSNVTCTNVTPASLALGSLDAVVVTVTYNAAASGSAYVRLQASNANANNIGQINSTIVPSAAYAIAVTPDAKPIGVLPNTSASYPFTVRNSGTAQNTFDITATCAGSAIASGCTPSSNSVTIPAGGSSVVTVAYTSGGTSTTGTIKLAAAQSNDPGVKDTGWVNLATGTAQLPLASVSTVNPGVSVERGLCITVALAGGAAECGDLRLAHALPAVRTMNRARAPTLVYSSAQAHIYPLVAAEVTLAATAANPDSVEAVLRLNGIEKRRARWAGSAFSPGRANRIVIGADTLSNPTGVYSYTLEVTSIYPSGPLSATPAPSGELIVVSRSQSEFGAGWWLAGLERLYLDSMLWVGGDGSARVYRSAGTNVWASAAVDRPDTLKKVGNEYVRLLPGKAEVWFDTTGRHVRTISRLRHDTTFFHRSSDPTHRLDSITVAPASQALRYKFVYNTGSGLLDSVIAPPIGSIPRAVKLTTSAAQVTAMRDPDTSSVSFGYDGPFANRVISRTDRMGTVAKYFFDAAGKVVRDSLDPGFNQPVIVTKVRPHESAGFIGSAALDTSIATAAIDGPRTDVGDTTLFWADRFGAPRRIRNAFGYETNVRRENATFPALVTRSQGPSGAIMRAHYDSRGNVDTLTDSATIVNGQPAKTRYVWDAVWDAVTRIVPPENDSTVIGIEAATGHRIWQQDASGSVSRDTFTNYANGLLATIKEAGATAVTTFNYDTRGNLSETISPLGFHSFTYTDNIGRDTLTVSAPLDQAQPTKLLRSRTIHDLSDQVIKSVTWAPDMPYTVSGGVAPDTMPVPADSVVVETLYDREGRPIEVSGPTVETRTYDRAGRLLTKRVGSGPTGLTYDAAGNVTRETYRGGATVTAQFDALNRVALRVVPRTAYPRTSCAGHMPGPVIGDPSSCLYHAPYFPNIVGDSLEIPADTLVFAYDSGGNMVRADNRYAQVRRTYYVNGLPATDTLRMRNYVGTDFGHTYQLAYGYDRDGRRLWMNLGGVSSPSDSFTYAYSPANGALTQVTDRAGRRYALTYTPAARPDSLKVFAVGSQSPGIKESSQYDADGRLVRRERRTGAGAGLQLDIVSYTPVGKVREVSASSAAASQGSLTITNAYNGLGAVVASQTQSNSSVYWNLEEFRTDKIGNVWYEHTRYAAEQVRAPNYSFYKPDGLLWARKGVFPEGCAPSTVHLDTLYQVADAAGNVILSGELRKSACDNNAHNHQTATNSYYSSDNRLMVVQKWTDALHTWEEYWYDALGRRILTRTRHDLPFCGYPIICPGFVDRTVWDGDQIIAEQRTSGLDDMTGGAPHFGTIRYVHMLGIDAPVAILDSRFSDARVLHYNWRGLAEASSWSDGSPADVELGGSTRVEWPAGQGVYLQRASDPYAGLEVTWIGSLPANGKGDAGLLYRRNRYYDPASGRFTQEDPIGIGGGLNVYGFAAGDPVNFSDPFGLCPADVGGDGKTENVTDCPDDVKGAWAEKHIVINPTTDWENVDAGLRNAVVLASMELRKTFYVSAANEEGHAPTAHETGRGVDISRINGTRFAQMNKTTAQLLGNQVGATIANFLPRERGMEVYTPGMAFRVDRSITPDLRARMMAKHWHHVHVTVRPERRQ